MFGSRKHVQARESEIKTLISEGFEFEGNVKLTDGIAVRLDGKINGNISGKASLIVGKEGRIKGNVEVEKIVVYGVVEGNIKAEVVELHGGIVKGDIITKNLFVEKGSIFNGRCVMGEIESKGGKAPSFQSSSVEMSPTGRPSS